LILALTMMSRSDNAGSKDPKDCGAIYGKQNHKLFSLRTAGSSVISCGIRTCRS
jgi:hypothetical protein